MKVARPMKNNIAKVTALGGMMAALAVVIMSLGGMIPLSTFICPMLCILLLQFVLESCGSRIGWAWYGAVAFLSMMFGPDKEAVAVFVFLGYYPIIKPWFDGLKWVKTAKLVFFNAVILLMYWILMRFLGIDHIVQEYQELGFGMTVVTLILGNWIFLLLDLILGRKWRWQGKWYE